MPIPTEIVPSIEPSEKSPARITNEFKALLAGGATVLPSGEAKKRPSRLLRGGYLPKFKLQLFDTTFYLTSLRQNPDLRFFVAYVVQRDASAAATKIYPRIFYKDVSLIWRSPSHLAGPVDDYWVGKGDVDVVHRGGYEFTASREETTDLPLEMQAALDGLSRRVRNPRYDEKAVRLVLRRSERDRVRPYPDFTGPRRRAGADPRNLVNRGRSVARFGRRSDPMSLAFVSGFEPDFARGVLEATSSRSVMYGGELQRVRILSKNLRAQYMFFAGPSHAWVIPPQALTTELSSFGLRTIDVVAAEDLCVPGFEYHFMDHSQDPPVFVSQIPKGFVGPQSVQDPARADASAWLEQLPVIREFRRKVLGQSASRKKTRSVKSRRVPG
ncbi:MAG: hypothetical protein P8R42_18475 [Candidatus Binatia bacterium]|nr:hypothetical protein [Candidatus Binatia bacterium]